MISNTLKLTPDQYEWFGDRVNESRSGRVLVPNHCYNKFRKIAGNELLSNKDIKDWLIDNIYNSNDFHY